MIPKTMKACMLTAINTFEMRELPVPEPEPGEVLCRIKAIAICGTDPEIIKVSMCRRGGPRDILLSWDTSGRERWFEPGKALPSSRSATGLREMPTRVAGPAGIAWKETTPYALTKESRSQVIATTGSSPRERIANCHS